MVAVPLLLLSGPAQADHLPPAGRGRANAEPGQMGGWALRLAVWERLHAAEVTGSSTSTSVPLPPAPTPPPVTVAIAAPPPVTVTTAAAPPVTTVVATVTTIPVPPAPTSASQGSMSGEATWYTSPWATGCASPTLPFGTHLEVTNDETGASAPCVVDDREPYHPGRVLDLSYGVFTELATPDQGVITVTISW